MTISTMNVALKTTCDTGRPERRLRLDCQSENRASRAQLATVDCTALTITNMIKPVNAIQMPCSDRTLYFYERSGCNSAKIHF